jgi:hypothetical protein
MLKDRSLISILLFIPLLLLAIALKPRPAPVVVLPISADQARQGGAAGERFWTLKTHGKTRYDMILMGDSRVYRGISPAAMETILPDYRIFNFGYSGTGLDSRMAAAAERRLDPKSDRKSIVLGVTPLGLTPYAARDDHYLQELNRPADYVFLRLYWLPLVRSFEALDLRNIPNLFTGDARLRSQAGYYQEFHDDGWIASWSIPEDPYRTLPSFRDIFSSSPVSPRLIQGLIDQTRQWTAQGIHVYAYRVPSSPAMVALENQMSGFDEADFVKQFEAAGGIWYSIPLAPYYSFDGSHLVKQSAQQLSLDLAKLIKATEANPFPVIKP